MSYLLNLRTNSILLLAAILAAIAIAPPTRAQTYRTGAASAIVDVQPGSTCSTFRTWYGPSLFTYGNGDLGFVAQSSRPPGSSCDKYPSIIDDFYSARRNASTGLWTGPATNACPTLQGRYNRCGFSSSNSGPLGNPSVVKVGSTYYMAFNGGNADFISGRIYWATSTNGVNWSVYNVDPPAGEAWTPLVARNSPAHECGPVPPVVGISEIALAYDAGDHSMGSSGTFYLYFSHHGLAPDQNSGGPLDTWGVRFAYSPKMPFGLGTEKEIWHRDGESDGAWKTFDSGRMVWSYDVDTDDYPGEPVLAPYHGRNQSGWYRYGTGDLRHDSISGKWLHVFTGYDGITRTQTTSSLSSNLWSAPTNLNDTTVRNLTPPGTNPDYSNPIESGLYSGQLGNRTGMWIFPTVNYLGCNNSVYLNRGIAQVELCTTSPPTLTSVSPSTDTATGGIEVTLSGNNLDCASEVQFGGVVASIVSRTKSQVHVTAPPHASGVVNVSVATPAGTATKTSAFTYTGAPAYSGWHEEVDCYKTTGWAWDANQPNGHITVDVYDGSTLLGSTSANLFRIDLFNAGLGNGEHAFRFDLPASVRNGASHSIRVRFGGTGTSLYTTPRTIECQSLTITPSGTGSGTVTTSPSGIDCGATCSYWFPYNTAVSMSASPASGSSFGGWSGNGDCTDGSVTLSANRSCTATFTSSANAHVIWIQPSELAGFGSPNSLVIAGSATGAASGSRVQVSWRNVSLGGAWVTEPYKPLPNGNGIWYQQIVGANYSQLYEVRANYGGIDWPTCTYSGSGGIYWCP